MKFTAAVLVLAATGASAFAPPTFGRVGSSLAMGGTLTSQTGQSSLDPAVVERFNELPFPKDKILAEYVWCDAVGNTRSKTRTLPAAKGKSPDTLPSWNFDGSSTDQAPGDDSEVILK